jgi:hypothetical protein
MNNQKSVSNYLLYGEKMIEDDSTLKSFAQSVCDRVPIDEVNNEDFKDGFIEVVNTILCDDLSRTDVNYEVLMHQYRFEIGDLMYQIENHFGEVPPIKFFGEEAVESFNNLVQKYIDIHFDELVRRI